MAQDKVCFVIMGFGKKTDYPSGRTLDLDAAYRAIIKPAVEDAGLKCVRADDIQHSGVIDLPMYKLLLEADLVVADLSTANPNALYELGVRHALRPYCTILMREEQGNLYFDLDHTRTLKYRHLGEDIGFTEAARARAALKATIDAVIAAAAPDSPVYTFLPGLKVETVVAAQAAANEQLAASAPTQPSDGESRSKLLERGGAAMKRSDFAEAVTAFRAADDLRQLSGSAASPPPPDPYTVQQLALATYKLGRPTTLDALTRAREIIERLDPARSLDPETLGIAGAIEKRLWEATQAPDHIEQAIRFYGRGFQVRRDYYTGENAATCHDAAAWAAADQADEAAYHRVSARKIREELIDTLSQIEADPHFHERDDVRWVHATHSHVSLAMGDTATADAHDKAFRALAPADWEVGTFEAGLQYARRVAASQQGA